MRRFFSFLAVVGIALPLSGEQATNGTDCFAFKSTPQARFKFGGVIGDRIEANITNWLLRAPQSNPGIIGMFHLRDRKPVPNLVPWAGEFAGKYLLSAIQAVRQTDQPALSNCVAQVVEALLATQAENGYLGPFPEKDQLKGNWDLWGHYHCMLALLEWHQLTGDRRSLDACVRMADLMCRVYLDGSRSVYDAGSHEMNMAVIHGLARLYRLTRQHEHLELIRLIEQDWERAGDYLRTGLCGVEFYKSPRPRWESLHDIQGLVELYAITGDVRYRRAFEHHWRSIARFDRRNSGAFSSSEQATGNPYEPTPIETCCTVAWMALSVDMLRLTGDARVADELELSTLNAAAGAQHPSGSWWTYNTPMDGVREASAHSIVFQARAGTPELNCCSVNGPRSLGMLTDWAVMQAEDGWVINWFGPMELKTSLADGILLVLRVESDYPRSGRVSVCVAPQQPRRFAFRIRIPSWSTRTEVVVDGNKAEEIVPGSYLLLNRTWFPNSRIEIEFDMALRAVAGARQAAGKVSLYRGPVLLAYDQRHNAFDEDQLRPIDLGKISEAKMIDAQSAGAGLGPMFPKPWLLVDVPSVSPHAVRLCDFATAGASGTRYRSWLAATNAPPPPLFPLHPSDGAAVPPGRAVFRWSKITPGAADGITTSIVIWESENCKTPVLVRDVTRKDRTVLAPEEMSALQPEQWYEWEMRTARQGRFSVLGWPRPRFRIDPTLPLLDDQTVQAFMAPPAELLVSDPLPGSPKPRVGRLISADGMTATEGIRNERTRAVRLDGMKGRIVYGFEEFPEESYSVLVWFRIRSLPEQRLGQVVSAWARGMDDPIRVCVEQGQLYARIEAGNAYSTPGVPITVGDWHCVAAVKDGATLTLWLDGKARASADVPSTISSSSRMLGLGGNPLFAGNEYLAIDAADLNLWARALTADEITARSTFDIRGVR